MSSGGCFCSKIRVSYTGEPIEHALCHCLDCRKISGGLFSNNYIIPKSNFKIESGVFPFPKQLPGYTSKPPELGADNVKGSPKTISKVSDAGDKITNHFCPDCGTTLFRDAESMPGTLIVKMGIMDDPEWPNKHVATLELFSGRRVNWLQPLPGAKQKPAM